MSTNGYTLSYIVLAWVLIPKASANRIQLTTEFFPLTKKVLYSGEF